MSERASPQQSLAERVFGVKDRSRGSLVLAHYVLTGEIATPESFLVETKQLVDYINDSLEDTHTIGAIYEADTEKVEKGVAAAIVRQIFTEPRIKGFNNVLYSWPFYQQLYERFVSQEAVNAAANSVLLIGSYTSLSSQAFKALASDVYGSDQAYIIDTNASDPKRRPNELLIGDGLYIPFQNATIRIAQTNLLIHMLRGTGGEVALVEEQERANTRRLLSEIFRVMQGGGHLLMREVPPRINFQDKAFTSDYNQSRIAAFKQMLSEELTSAGFADTTLMPVWEPKYPDFLFDPSRSFKSHSMTMQPISVGVYAKKPAT
ncbi:MAG TPA: hypothetical protein VFZ58_00100 [Candidatus Saccharimonadales bacterium]